MSSSWLGVVALVLEYTHPSVGTGGVQLSQKNLTFPTPMLGLGLLLIRAG